jgi:hypothetical protein
VVVTLTDQAGHQHQTITDIYGRYVFLIEPGQYTITAQKSGYQFPSRIMAGESDVVYDYLYHGQAIRVEATGHIQVNIPMDPVQPNWNEQEKVRLGLSPHFWPGRATLLQLSRWLFWLGVIWSIVVVVIAPSVFNSLILLLYAAILLVRLVSRWRNPLGIVLVGRQPLAGAVVRLSQPDLPGLKYPPLVTGASGQYAFLVDAGHYQLAVETKQAEGDYQEVARTDVIQIDQSPGSIHHRIRLKSA